MRCLRQRVPARRSGRLVRHWGRSQPRRAGCIEKFRKVYAGGVPLGEPGQAKPVFDKRQNRGVVRRGVGDVMRLGKWRDHDEWQTEATAVKISRWIGWGRGKQVLRWNAIRAGNNLGHYVGRI